MNYEIKSEYINTIGITIGKNFWGRGYGRDSIITLANYLFEEKEIEKIEIEVVFQMLGQSIVMKLWIYLREH